MCRGATMRLLVVAAWGLLVLVHTRAAGIGGAVNTSCIMAALDALKGMGMSLGRHEDFVFTDRLALKLYLDSPPFEERKAELRALPEPSRGILIPAGGRARMAGAYIVLKAIRELLNSTMAAEVVYNGPQELDEKMAKMLLQLQNVTLVDGSKVPLPRHHGTSQESARKHGWSFKTWALVYVTRFKEVLLLDADNTPLVPPEAFFATREYEEAGNLFWPDFTRGGEHPLWKPKAGIYRKLGLPVPWEQDGNHRTAESGQVLLDRSRHADVLEWLWYLNAHHELWQDDLHGDKDTYKIAFMLANKTEEYRQVHVRARQALGYMEHERNYHHRGMIQHLPDGRLASHHRTSGAKLLEHCSSDTRAVEGCRVRFITGHLSPEQAMASSNKAWTWDAGDLDFDAAQNLQCKLEAPNASALDSGYGSATSGASGRIKARERRHRKRHGARGVRGRSLARSHDPDTPAASEPAGGQGHEGEAARRVGWLKLMARRLMWLWPWGDQEGKEPLAGPVVTPRLGAGPRFSKQRKWEQAQTMGVADGAASGRGAAQNLSNITSAHMNITFGQGVLRCTEQPHGGWGAPVPTFSLAEFGAAGFMINAVYEVFTRLREELLEGWEKDH